MISSRNRYHTYSDENLMALVKSRDQVAFEELYQRYSKPLLNYFYRMLGQREELARDFLQELFTKLVDQPERYKNGCRFSSWFYAIAHNMCKNEYRRMEVRNRNQKLFTETKAESDPDRILDNKTFHAALEKALDCLSAEQRSVFILRFQEQLTIREIHEILDCSEGTVKSRLFYSVRKLAEELKDFKPDEPR